MDIWFDIKYTYSFTIDSMQPAYGQKILPRQNPCKWRKVTWIETVGRPRNCFDCITVRLSLNRMSEYSRTPPYPQHAFTVINRWIPYLSTIVIDLSLSPCILLGTHCCCTPSESSDFCLVSWSLFTHPLTTCLGEPRHPEAYRNICRARHIWSKLYLLP